MLDRRRILVGFLLLLSAILSFYARAQKGSPQGFDQQTTLTRAKEDYNQGNYPESLRGALAVYESAVRENNKPVLADAENLIGLVDLAQGQANVAVSYFKKALYINRDLRNAGRMAANLLNISLAQSDLNDLDSAVVAIKASLKISTVHDLKILTAMGRNHLGDFYLRKHKFKQAESEFKTVLDNDSYQSDWENSFACTGMAKLFFAKKQYKQAASYADRAYNLALAADAKWDAVQALEIAHKAYRATGDDHRAYDRLLVYKNGNDSLFNASKDKELNKLQLREKSVENMQLENQIQIVSQQRKIDRLVIMIVAVALLLIITFAAIIYRRVRLTASKNRALRAENEATVLRNQVVELRNEELSMINQDNNRLFSIIGHDLRSPFASIETTLALFKAGHLDQEELVSLLEKLSAQINTASGMLNSLLIWSANQMGGLSFKPVAVDLNLKVDKVVNVSMAAATHKRINITHERMAVPLVFGDADQIRIMIQNLVANAIKFTRENGTVRIYYVQATYYFDLVVEDNGVGMSGEKLRSVLTGDNNPSASYGTSNEKGIGLGLHLVRDFAAQNDIIFLGESTVKEGTKFSLRFNPAKDS